MNDDSKYIRCKFSEFYRWKNDSTDSYNCGERTFFIFDVDEIPEIEANFYELDSGDRYICIQFDMELYDGVF